MEPSNTIVEYKSQFDSLTSNFLKTYMNLEVIKEKFKKEYFPNIKIINFCGSIDEPMSHPQIKDIIKYSNINK